MRLIPASSRPSRYRFPGARASLISVSLPSLCRTTLFLLLFTGLSYGIHAQDTAETGEDSFQTLVDNSLSLDIDTAGRDELIAWNMVLGLESSGTDDSLRQTLLSYYGIGAGGDVSASSASGARIVIESASRSEYMQVEIDGSNDESVVRLSGNVVVTVTEEGRDRSHRVEADTVIFNQANKTISALGDIRYSVDTGGRTENFSGDSLTFEVTDWTGVIFRGTSERNQDVGGQEVDFFFRGESIKRAGPDILILEDGAITSHDSDNPDYALRAKKIWITGPGEWGLFSATLYVGHVPVFYLPFYWKSGSDLVFNPVIGTRSRMGYYIQTTTYLMGRKEEDDGFAILGFGDTASGDYNLERDGLFLVRNPTGEDGKTSGNNTLKYMLDAYTSLGAMTGFMGEFPKIGESGTIGFYATVGVSRSVDENGNPYFNDGSSTGVYWNNSYLGPVEIPFRWGTKFDISWDNWSLYLDWYSDPFYLQDFGNRKENFDWLSFLLSEDETDANDPDLVTSMKWEIRGSESISPVNTSPWLQSVSMDNFRTSLTWRNKTNKDIIPDSPTPIPSPDAYYDPARNFYYPDQLILPDLKLSLRGAAPNWSKDRLTSLDIPEEEAGAEESENEDEESGPESTEYLASFDSLYNAGLVDASLNYGFQTQLYVEDQTNSDNWDAPSDIDFVFDAARVNTTQRGDLSYGIDFWDGFTGMKGSTNFSGFYQTHEDMFGNGVEISDSTKLEDYQYSQFLWDNTVSMYVKPLQGVSSLSSSSLTYDFDGNIYAYQFADDATITDPGYTGSWISGEDEIRRHEAAGKLAWNTGPFGASSTATGNIPPLDQRYTLAAGLDFGYEGWKAAVSQQTNYENDAWNLQPLVMNASWTGWRDEVLLSQNARYDSEYQRWSSSESVFGFWGFETRFVANYGFLYKWNDDSDKLIWEEDGKGFSPSTLRFSYDRDFDPKPFWKNRLTYRTILNTSWNINLKQSTDNVLVFKWTQELQIYKFLDFQFSFSAANKSMYLYFQGWRDELGIEESHNFFEDLGNSFNFFDVEDRRQSQFNMDRIDVALIHHLRNWDLTVEYSGWPALDSENNVYRWKSEFSLYVKWNPLPMFNQRTRFEDDSWTVDSFETDQ